MNFGIIYKVTSPSARVYVGQTTQHLNERKSEHIRLAHLLQSQVYNTKLSRAIRKYGDQLKWEILYKDIPENMLNIAEMCAIYTFDSYENGYNCTLGGEGSCGYKFTENQLKNLSNAHMGQHPWNKGLTKEKDERLMKLSKSKTGKIFSEEHKQKLSVAHTGKKIHSPEYLAKLSKRMQGNVYTLGRIRPLEEKMKISKNHVGMTGKHHTPESKEKMSIIAQHRQKQKDINKNEKEK